MKNLVAKPKPEEKGFRLFILRLLNARVSLPSWMLALSSAALAWAAMFLLFFTAAGLGPFGAALPVTGFLWTPLIFLATTATVVGLVWVRRINFLRYGAFGSFVLWIFGGVAFIASGQALTAGVVILPWLIFYAYIYLASFFRDETGI